MTAAMRAAARARLEQGRRVLADTEQSPERIQRVLRHSEQVRLRAVPLLRRAGYLR